MKVLDGGEDTFQFSKDGSTITIRPKPWLTGLKSPPVILYRKGTKMADQTQNRYPALLSQAKRASGTMNLRHSDVEVANYNRIPPDLAKEARFVEGSFILKRDLLYAYNGERLPSGEPKLDFSRPAISLAPGDLPPNVWNGTIFHVDKRNNDVISLPHRGSPVREGKLIKLKP